MCDADVNGSVETCTEENVRHFSKLFTFHGSSHFPFEPKGLSKRHFCCHDVGWLDTGNQLGFSDRSDRLIKYAAWNQDPVLKPQVITNQTKPVSDPERWAQITTPGYLPAATLKRLASIVAELKLCVIREKGGKPSTADLIWKDRYVEVRKRYANLQGRTLLQIGISEAFKRDCKARLASTEDLSPFSAEFWLAHVPGTEPVIHVFSSQDSVSKLELIEFGDFDGDGKSEGLFLFRGYNRDGYVLFSENMTKATKFFWGYH